MPDVYKTIDNQNFSVPGASPSQINQLIWQGLPGKYIAVADDGLYTTIDGGVTWGKLYPNTPFGTTLPGGAIPHQLAFSVGPNDGGDCNVGCVSPIALDFSTSDDEGLLSVAGSPTFPLSGNLENKQGALIWILSYLSGGSPGVPSITNAEVTWDLVKSVLFGERRLSLFIADSFPGVIADGQVTFPEVPTLVVGGLLVISSAIIEAVNVVAASGSDDSPVTHLPTFGALGSTLLIVGSDGVADSLNGNGSLSSVQAYGSSSQINGEVFWQAGENTDPGATWSGLDHEWGAIALEVRGCYPGNGCVANFTFANFDGISDVTDFGLTGMDVTYEAAIIYISSKVATGSPNIPTIISAFTPPITWNLVNTVVFGTNHRISVFIADRDTWDSNSISSGDETVDFGGQVQTEHAGGLLTGFNVDTNNTLGVIQSATNSGSSDTATATLSAFGPNGVTLLFVGSQPSLFSDVNTGLNGMISEADYTDTTLRSDFFWKASENLTPAIQFPSSRTWGAIAVEILGCV